MTSLPFRLQAVGTVAGALALGLINVPVHAATFLLLDQDEPGIGFNDPTQAQPVPGNPGVTLGQQRFNAFQSALDIWGSSIESDVVIRVHASFDALECNTTSGLLGGAAPFDFLRDFPGAPRAATWYPYALADSLAGVDLAPDEPDIIALFNRSLDEDPDCFTGFTWWYGTQGAVPPDTMPFASVVLHEIGHGLGFTTLVNPETGERAEGFDDIYMSFLEDHSAALLWTEMSDEERATSAADPGDLHWVGFGARRRGPALSEGPDEIGHLPIYAPDPVDVGSSLSHWDPALLPDELMEPFLSLGAQNLVTPGLFEDLGYRLLTEEPDTCTPSTTALCIDDQPEDGRFRVEVDFVTLQGGGASGQGRAIPLDSLGVSTGGVFWFFSPDNPELLVKVINGCTVNDHHWVFYSAGTNVGILLTVTDTRTGRTFVATNPDRNPAPPVQDTRAFPCAQDEGEGGEGEGEGEGTSGDGEQA